MRFSRHHFVAVLMLSLALLACGEGGTAVSGARATVGLSTATPGGSISVWLLTTTPTLEGQPRQITTPLAPIATASAEAQQTAIAAAATTTPPAAIAPPEQCPPLSAATMPADKPLFSRFPEVIGKFLSSGGATTILEAGLRTWKAITDKSGLVRADRDMTGDGVAEVLVDVLDPAYAGKSPQPGDLFIFGCQGGAYRLLYDAGYSPERSAPAVVSTDDLNGDGFSDVIYTAETCPADTCAGEVDIIGWNATTGSFGSLAGGPMGAYRPDVVVSDTPGASKEISVTSAANPDPAAGPQRTTTTVLRWSGTQFAVVRVLKSPAQYRIQVIYDGDDALAAGDGSAAADAYLRAAEAPDLLEWGIADETALLSTFARYRLLLAYTLANRLDQAQATHDQLLQFFAPPATVEGQPTPLPVSGQQPGREFANMADLFWQNFAVNRDMKRACAGVIEYAQATRGALAPLNSFGYANKQYTPADMCPLK